MTLVSMALLFFQKLRIDNERTEPD